MLPIHFRSLFTYCLLAFFFFPNVFVGQDDKLDPADKRKIDVLMRLRHIDVSEKPKLKATVVRVLNATREESQFLVYAERFKIVETLDRLWKIVGESKEPTQSVKAMSLLLQQLSESQLLARIEKQDQPIELLKPLGLVGSKKSIELMKKLVSNKKLSAEARNEVVKGLGRQLVGQRFLLDLVEKSQLPEECNFTVANLLMASTDPEIKRAARERMSLPAAAGSKPLSPIFELVERKGDIDRGQKVFIKKGTCANCHKVHGNGKEVGPDLTEIGTKLSRQAMYEAILNPSVAVSHNYETYLIETIDGLSFSGVLQSETDDKIVIRTAEAITKEIPKDEIEGMKKSKQSLMPADLQKNFSEAELVDLVEYLMTLKKKAG